MTGHGWVRFAGFMSRLAICIVTRIGDGKMKRRNSTLALSAMLCLVLFAGNGFCEEGIANGKSRVATDVSCESSGEKMTIVSISGASARLLIDVMKGRVSPERPFDGDSTDYYSSKDGLITCSDPEGSSAVCTLQFDKEKAVLEQLSYCD